MAARSDISKEELLSGKYIIEPFVSPETGRFTIRVIKDQGCVLIGYVEKKYGYLQVVGGTGKEHRDLIDAIKSLVDSFLDSHNEFEEVFNNK